MPPLRRVSLCLLLALGLATANRPLAAFPPEALDSVVSVLPLWPGRGQGVGIWL